MRRLWEEEVEAGSHTFASRLSSGWAARRRSLGPTSTARRRLLEADQQRTAASIFRFLVTSGGTKIALTAKDLVDLSGVSESDLDPVLHRLCAGDLHILRPIAPHDGRREPRPVGMGSGAATATGR